MSAQPVEHPQSLLSVLTDRPLTIADLMADDTPIRKEIIDGGLFVTPWPDIEHQALVTDLTVQLYGMCPRRGGLRVFAGINVVSEPGTLIIPDVAVADAGVTGVAFLPEQLALVVEVTSSSTRRTDLSLKRELYREWKIPFVIVDRGQKPAAVIVEGELPEWVGDLTI